MPKKSKKHNPSAYRGLIREQKSKNGRDINNLIQDAQTLDDPYYRSLALFRLSDDAHLSVSKAKPLALKAIQLAKKEPRTWRQGELYAKLAKHAKAWKEKSSTKENELFLDEILNGIENIPKGKELSQNFGEISKHIGCSRLPSLLEIAVNNTDFVLDDCKTVVRQWATTCSQKIPPYELFTILSKIKDPYLRAKLLGYLYLQCHRQNIKFPKAFQKAIASSLETDGKKQLSAFRYLSRHIQSKSDFEKLKDSILQIPQAGFQAQLYATLAGHADKKGYLTLRDTFFKNGLEKCEDIKSVNEKEKKLFTISKGILKTKDKEKAEKILERLHQNTNDDQLKQKIAFIMKQYNLTTEYHQSVIKTKSTSHNVTSTLPPSSGLILGLYDTYEGSIKPIHIRTLARAAPLCAAFGLDLGLIGFPINDKEAFIKQVITDTTIGKGGLYMKYLYEHHRIHVYTCDQHSIPVISKKETIIATTAKPDVTKKITMNESIKIHQENKNHLIIVMGLGKNGLPHSFLGDVNYHLELTGVNVSLETCTAMGIISLKMYEEYIRSTKR
jgi:hypothetical protein